MRIDIESDTDNFCENPYFQTKMEPKSNLNELIFSAPVSDLKFSNGFVLQHPNDERIVSIFSDSVYRDQTVIAGGRVGGSAQGRIDISWGGSEGTKTEVEVQGEIHNNRGDNLGLIYHKDSDGNSSAKVDAASSKDTNSKGK
jgi:hypothetical protein